MKKIFLISQPRSGSSLLQHVLGSHSRIETFPETWLYLPLFYSLRREGHQAEYSAKAAYDNMAAFLDGMTDGRKVFLKRMASVVDDLYESAGHKRGATHILEKTPRYYFILPELEDLFEDARFVLLRRNPLAVLASIVNYNFGGRWDHFMTYDRVADLLDAPALIDAASNRLGDRAITVNYETFVTNPEAESLRISGALGLFYEPMMVNYGGRVNFETGVGFDRKSLYKHERPVADYTDRWKESYRNPQMRRLGLEYLERLGGDLIERMGYRYDELVHTLGPMDNFLRITTVPWDTLEKDWHRRTTRERIRTRIAKWASPFVTESKEPKRST